MTALRRRTGGQPADAAASSLAWAEEAGDDTKDDGPNYRHLLMPIRCVD